MKLLHVMALLALTTVGLAGCLDGNAPTESPGSGLPWTFVEADNPMPHGGDHNHTDPAQHLFAKNMAIVDEDDLQRFGASPEEAVGAHAVDLQGDLLVVGMFGPLQQGFHLFNISNPDELQHVSFYAPGGPVNGDRTVAMTEDAQTVFLGHSRGELSGVEAVDVSNPRLPVRAAFFTDPLGYGPHTVTTANIDGEQYVFLLSFGVTILRYTDGNFELVSRYITNDELSVLDGIDPNDPAATQTFATRSLYGHDMTLFNDPVTGKPFLVVAYAYDGVKVLDLSTPEVPILVARWNPEPEGSHAHYVHSAELFRDADDRAILVVGPETFEPANQDNPSRIWILDATDALVSTDLTPDYEGAWVNPAETSAGFLGRSAHFFRIQDGIMVLSHYHGGVWAVDLRTAEARADPPTLGYIMPVGQDPAFPPVDCCFYDTRGTPMVYDVEVKGNRIYAVDEFQGVFQIAFEA